MASSERGMALVSIIVILAALLSLAQILFEKVWYSTRQAGISASRAQISWAAKSGIETARERLLSTYAMSSGWGDYLSMNVGQAYSSNPLWTADIAGGAVDIYVRDNPDGDHDFHHDNDLKVYVLSRATNAQGLEAIVEVLCELEGPGVRGNNAGSPAVNRHIDLADHPASTFDIVED